MRCCFLPRGTITFPVHGQKGPNQGHRMVEERKEVVVQEADKRSSLTHIISFQAKKGGREGGYTRPNKGSFNQKPFDKQTRVAVRIGVVVCVGELLVTGQRSKPHIVVNFLLRCRRAPLRAIRQLLHNRKPSFSTRTTTWHVGRALVDTV